MADEIVISIDRLWKRYGLPLIPALRRGRQRLRSLGSRQNPQSAIGNPQQDGPWALRDINLEVHRGETLGIIGRNGAGKSTLLKVLAGVTPPTRGRIKVEGRAFPMIELNAGIHPDLTGRENAYLLGAIMGVPRQEMKARMPEIEEFCELGEWFDRPVRQHSSGMLARLGFGVAMHASADVLLIDEVLAVGDFAFQKKCINHMTQLSSSGVTALFVSHNPYIIERMCDRVILLQNGATEELGNPMDVIYRYFQMGMNHSADFNGGLPANLRPGTGDLRIQKVEILSNNGLPTQEVVTGDALTIRLHYMTTESLWEPQFSIRIFDPQNTMVISLESTVARKGIELSGGGYIDCSVGSFPLMPSVYTFQIKVGAGVTLDMYENAAKLVVRPLPEALVDSGNKGIVYVKADWDYRPRTALTQE